MKINEEKKRITTVSLEIKTTIIDEDIVTKIKKQHAKKKNQIQLKNVEKEPTNKWV